MSLHLTYSQIFGYFRMGLSIGVVERPADFESAGEICPALLVK